MRLCAMREAASTLPSHRDNREHDYGDRVRIEGYRMVTGHPEWWIRDVQRFD